MAEQDIMINVVKGGREIKTTETGDLFGRHSVDEVLMNVDKCCFCFCCGVMFTEGGLMTIYLLNIHQQSELSFNRLLSPLPTSMLRAYLFRPPGPTVCPG